MEDEARIQLEFNMGTDVDVAATDIREALNRIREDLPDGANEPTIRKIDTNATTVAQVFLVGDRTQDDLYDYADDVIADRFSSVPGVGEVRVYGANRDADPRPAGPRKTDRNEPVDQRCRHEAQGEQRP